MTKAVRIENADNSVYKVRVRVQHKDTATGEWVDAPTETKDLPYPTFMLDGSRDSCFLTSHRRLIVEEYE